MIRSFADREAELIFRRRRSRKYGNVQSVILRKLLVLHGARLSTDLVNPPGNRFEALKGDRKGQHSIRINDQFRLCFRWEERMRTTSRSSTITKPSIKRTYDHRMPPIHPGEMLREEFLIPLGLSANALAISIRVPATRVSEIVNERRGITADTALRLGRYFGMTPEFWMNLQSHYDLECARDAMEQEIKQSVRPAPRDKKTGSLRAKAVA